MQRIETLNFPCQSAYFHAGVAARLRVIDESAKGTVRGVLKPLASVCGQPMAPHPLSAHLNQLVREDMVPSRRSGVESEVEVTL
jgi:hypothetical protein